MANAYFAEVTRHALLAGMVARREPMSSVDTAWLHMDRPVNLMQIMGVLRFRRRLSLAAVRHVVEQRFAVHERFRMRPVDVTLGAAWVVDEEFDLRSHLREVVLKPGAGEAALSDLLGELAATPLDPAAPRWEFVLVQVSTRRSALVIRVHHCYADGIALVRVVLGLGDPDPAAEATSGDASDAPHADSPVEGWLGGLLPAAVSRGLAQGAAMLEQGVHLALHPLEAGAAARAGAGLAAELAHVALLPDEPSTALRGRLAGVKGVAWAKPVALDEVRAVAHALGCTINDVLIAAVAATLGAWLQSEAGARTEGLCLRAAVPVNLRTADCEEALGNRFGLVFVTLPVRPGNALERVYAVHTEMKALKHSFQPMMSLGLLAALGSAPRVLQDQAVDLLSRKASVVMSNVPGPRAPLFICGARVDEMMFWVPQSGNIGLGVSVLTYDGKVQFGVVADAECVSVPARLVKHFAVEVRRLLAAVSTR